MSTRDAMLVSYVITVVALLCAIAAAAAATSSRMARRRAEAAALQAAESADRAAHSARLLRDEEHAAPPLWLACPNGGCTHSGLLHDVDELGGTPMCCVDRCRCGQPAAAARPSVDV